MDRDAAAGFQRVQRGAEPAELGLGQESLAPPHPVSGDRPAGIARRRDEPPIGGLLDQPRQRGDRLVGRRRAVGEAVLEGRDLLPPDRGDRGAAERRQDMPVDRQAVLRDCCGFATDLDIFAHIAACQFGHGGLGGRIAGEQRGGLLSRPVGGDRPVPAERDPSHPVRRGELHHIGLAPRGLDHHPEPGELAVAEQGRRGNAERIHAPRGEPALACPSIRRFGAEGSVNGQGAPFDTRLRRYSG